MPAPDLTLLLVRCRPETPARASCAYTWGNPPDGPAADQPSHVGGTHPRHWRLAKVHYGVLGRVLRQGSCPGGNELLGPVPAGPQAPVDQPLPHLKPCLKLTQGPVVGNPGIASVLDEPGFLLPGGPLRYPVGLQHGGSVPNAQRLPQEADASRPRSRRESRRYYHIPSHNSISWATVTNPYFP